MVVVREGGVEETIYGRPTSITNALARAVKRLAARGFTNFSSRCVVDVSSDYRKHFVTGYGPR